MRIGISGVSVCLYIHRHTQWVDTVSHCECVRCCLQSGYIPHKAMFKGKYARFHAFFAYVFSFDVFLHVFLMHIVDAYFNVFLVQLIHFVFRVKNCFLCVVWKIYSHYLLSMKRTQPVSSLHTSQSSLWHTLYVTGAEGVKKLVIGQIAYTDKSCSIFSFKMY